MSALEAKRSQFVYEGQLVYEWQQTLDDVLVFVKPPPGIRGAQISCVIESGRVALGLKGNPPFLDHKLPALCVARDSCWTLDDGELVITLTKARKGETWPAAFEGHGTLDAVTATDVQRAMLLERFQQEHPGMDFSGATLNGTVPDPRTFMGGMSGATYR